MYNYIFFLSHVILKNNIMDAKASVIIFAKIRGVEFKNTPYTIHSAKPKQKITYIVIEISLTERVFITLITCGKNAKVVQNAAKDPITSTKKIDIVLLFLLHTCCPVYYLFNLN